MPRLNGYLLRFTHHRQQQRFEVAMHLEDACLYLLELRGGFLEGVIGLLLM
jgi:hypothetical protein